MFLLNHLQAWEKQIYQNPIWSFMHMSGSSWHGVVLIDIIKLSTFETNYKAMLKFLDKLIIQLAKFVCYYSCLSENHSLPLSSSGYH